MQRIVIIIIAVLVVAAGGWSALWFMNSATAEQKMREALATLARAGAPNTYDSIEISGFPFSYRGTVSNLVFGGEEDGARVSLPTVAAEISIVATDTVVFSLPPSFQIAPPGVSPEQGLEIASQALEAAVRLVDENAYDLSLNAEALSARLPDGQTPLALEGLDVSGQLGIAEDDAVMALALRADTATQTLPPLESASLSVGAPDGEAALTQTATRSVLSGLKIDVDGSLRKVGADVAADKVQVAFDQGGVMELTEPSYAVEATPKDRFDPSFLSEAEDFESALAAFARMAAHGVARGGQASAAFALGGAVGSGMIEGAPARLELNDFAVAFDLGAKRIGLTFAGEKILLDATLPGEGALYYDGGQIEAEYFTTPAEAFDFSVVADMLQAGQDPTEDLIGQSIAAAVGDQIVQGGAVEIRASAGPSVTRAPTEPGVAPFRQLESRVGASTFRMALNPDETVLKATVESLAYQVSGGFEGGGAVSAFDLDVAAPMRAAPQDQTATARFGLGEITLDDTVWDAVDPDAALERSIPGLLLSADANVLIRRDILSPDAALTDMSDPALLPGEITINDSFASALGLRLDLSGALSLVPLPQGALTLTVTGWKGFLDRARQTPLGRDPGSEETLAMLDGLWTRYRDPASAGEEDQAVFAVEMGAAGLMVNGEPFETTEGGQGAEQDTMEDDFGPSPFDEPLPSEQLPPSPFDEQAPPQ